MTDTQEKKDTLTQHLPPPIHTFAACVTCRRDWEGEMCVCLHLLSASSLALQTVSPQVTVFDKTDNSGWQLSAAFVIRESRVTGEA